MVETLGHLNEPNNQNSRKVTKVVRIKLCVRVLNVSSLTFFIIINHYFKFNLSINARLKMIFKDISTALHIDDKVY